MYWHRKIEDKGTVKFIVDNNVGRLARALRALGHDALFINPIDDSRLIQLAQKEGRIILTKDTGVLRRRVVASGEIRALRILGDDWRQQLGQVVEELGLETSPSFSRCIECNVLLVGQTREEAREHVPAYVYRTQESFLACSHCGRHYWQGTHWSRMKEDFEKMFG